MKVKGNLILIPRQFLQVFAYFFKFSLFFCVTEIQLLAKNTIFFKIDLQKAEKWAKIWNFLIQKMTK